MFSVLSFWGIGHLRNFTRKSIDEGCHIHNFLWWGSRKYCAGNRNVVPYKAYAAEQFNSFIVVQSPRSIRGRCSNDLVLASSAFKLLCSLFNMPFAWGWYAVVRMFLVPRSCDNFRNISDSNRRHGSVTTLSGTPYLATHPVRNVPAVVYANISGIGNASHHRENLSTHVNRYD